MASEWSDIDLENGTISITKNYSRLLDRIGTPKSKAGVRVISIDKKKQSICYDFTRIGNDNYF